MTDCPSPDVAELRQRAARLQGHLAAAGLDGALLTQNTDRFYFSATLQSGYVFVPAAGDPLILVRRDPERAARECPLPVVSLESVRELGRRLRDHVGGDFGRIGTPLDVLPVGQAERLGALLGGRPPEDASRAVALTRAIKSPFEVAAIRRAAVLVGEALECMSEVLRPGCSELEVSARLEYEMRRRGHGGLVRMRGFNQEIFYGHVMAGRSAAEVSFLDAPTGGSGLSPAVSQGASAAPIGSGVPVVVDLVGQWCGYLSDQTRMFSTGEPGPQWRDAFQAALAVQAAVVEQARPGVPASRLFDAALCAAAKTPYADAFLGQRHKVSFVGHGLGLELDEMPFLARGFDLPLEPGMVFAVEPKFIFEGQCVVGVEDTYVLTDAGVERLTPSPQEFRVFPGS